MIRMVFSKRALGLALMVMATASVGLSSPAILACPFCSAPSKTLTEQLTDAKVAVHVHWESAREAVGSDPGSTTFSVVEALKPTNDPKLAVGTRITLPRHRPGTPNDSYLLLALPAGQELDWQMPIVAQPDMIAYLKAAPAPSVSVEQRLPYFAKYLETDDPVVSDDAYAEFANADYSIIKPVAKTMPRESIRKWLDRPTTSPGRFGLYGLLLGLCGNADDQAYLEKRIVEPSEDFRLGIDGMMSGYLILAGEKGLDVLEKTKLVNPKSSFTETYAAMQALRFMWQYGDGRISPDRLKQSMRILLSRPELADLVVADLARWKDWSAEKPLEEIYTQEAYGIPSIKRAIVRYMIFCAKDHPEGQAVPDHAVRAEKWLAETEAADPKIVKDAKRFMLLQ